MQSLLPHASSRPAAAGHARLSLRSSGARLGTRLPRRTLAVCNSVEDDGQPMPSRAEQLYSFASNPTRTGAEYGEGFVHYRFHGEPTHLDVDSLNERLKPMGAQRLRHALKPDEAFGMIFNFDNVVMDTRQLQRRAWQLLAAQESLPLPGLDRPQLYHMRPERAITEVLMWTRDWGDAQRLGWQLAGIYADLFHSIHSPQEGVREWLQALANFNVPCALVSSMDRAAVRAALERTGLHDYFMTLVTAEDDMETVAQRYLSAAMQLRKPPNLCVAFDSSPQGITAAHNCTMKAVAVLGTYRAWELQSADIACASLAELSVINVRRMFANHGAEFMDLKHDFHRQDPTGRRGRPTAASVLDP